MQVLQSNGLLTETALFRCEGMRFIVRGLTGNSRFSGLEKAGFAVKRLPN